jgi:hypothetical protein
MKSKPFKLFLSAAVLLVSSLGAQASVDSALSLDLTSFYQESYSVKGDIENGKSTKVRVNSKDLITLIGREAKIGFKNGSKLMVGTDGSVYVASPDGKTHTDVSAYLTSSVPAEGAVVDGKLNLSTGQQDRRNYYILTLELNLPEIRGTVTGVATETFSVSKPTRDGVQIFKGSTKASVSGQGYTRSKTSFFQGSATLKGREAAVLN